MRIHHLPVACVRAGYRRTDAFCEKRFCSIDRLVRERHAYVLRACRLWLLFTHHLRGGYISGMIEKFREKFPAPVLPLVCEASPAGGEAPRFRRYCAGADMGLSGATKP